MHLPPKVLNGNSAFVTACRIECCMPAVTKAVSRSSTIWLRCVVKRAGDALKPADWTRFDDDSTTELMRPIERLVWNQSQLTSITTDLIAHRLWRRISHLGPTRPQKSHSRWEIEFASFDRSNEAIAFVDWFNTTALNTSHPNVSFRDDVWAARTVVEATSHRERKTNRI
jgi:hypothetical protein